MPISSLILDINFSVCTVQVLYVNFSTLYKFTSSIRYVCKSEGIHFYISKNSYIYSEISLILPYMDSFTCSKADYMFVDRMSMEGF
jgi:hypothetical protein